MITYLPEGDDNHLGRALVDFLQRFVLNEADDVRSDDAGMRHSLHGLFLLLPVDNVANCENARMAPDFEVLVHSHEAPACQGVAERSKSLRVRLSAKRMNLHK